MLEVGGLLPQLTRTHAKLIIRQKEHALSCCRDVNTAQRWNKEYMLVFSGRDELRNHFSHVSRGTIKLSHSQYLTLLHLI